MSQVREGRVVHMYSPTMSQVVGIKDKRMGEEVCACVKLNVGQECTAEEITAFCKGQVREWV